MKQEALSRSLRLQHLQGKIVSRSFTVGVMGLGHVGFPLSLLLCRSGATVVGLERDQQRLSEIEKDRNPLAGEDEDLTPLLVEAKSSSRYRATRDANALSHCDIIIIAVATPVDSENKPDLHALTAAMDDVLLHAKDGVLVIVESTVPPGTCAGQISRQVMTQSRLILDETIFLGYSPERVMPGKLLLNQLSLPRVCGAEQQDVRALLATFYSEVFNVEVDVTDTTTAEFVKTVENTYRDVQIAFANEVAVRCGELGIGFHEVQRLVNKVPRRDVHDAGIGVGGHCIPKDPYLMLTGSRWAGDLIRSARSVNDRMPYIVCDLVDRWFDTPKGAPIQDRSICILGYAYLADSGDVRNSPAKVISEELVRRGYRVEIHDPYVRDFSGNLSGKLDSTRLHLLLVRHSEYSSLNARDVLGFDNLLEQLKQRD